VELVDAVHRRRTTNGAFLKVPVSLDHQRRLMDAASRAPSHFNSQPWRFVLIEDRETVGAVADLSGASMRQLLEEGTFWRRYLRYFRFSDSEMDEHRDGIHFDRMPAALRPFRRHMFGSTAQQMMNRLRVPATLGEDNRRLVADSPLLLATLLDRDEYLPDELSGFYSVIGLGAAIENVWLTTVELGMGMQFVSTPMEYPERWRQLEALIAVPEDLALMAIFRLGYLPTEAVRPRIDWTSRERKRFSQFVFRESCRSLDDRLDDGLDEEHDRLRDGFGARLP
jgi:nitroreductase